MQLFETAKWKEDGVKFQKAYEGGDKARLKLALALADEEYHHPECEKLSTRPEQRSFCFTHEKITEKSVLLIHGWTACPFEMRELGEFLFKQGYNVFGSRLAGHGTCIEDFNKYTYKDWESNTQKGLGIAALLGRETIVIGESMGGLLAVILAASFPNLVKKTVLCAPGFKFVDPKAEFAVYKLTRLLIPMVDMGPLKDWQEGYWYTKIPSARVAELVWVARKARSLGAQIISPTLIIQAENDLLVKANYAKVFFNSLCKLGPTQKKLILFPDGHHNLTIDLNPQKRQVFNWISEFIS